MKRKRLRKLLKGKQVQERRYERFNGFIEFRIDFYTWDIVIEYRFKRKMSGIRKEIEDSKKEEPVESEENGSEEKGSVNYDLEEFRNFEEGILQEYLIGNK